MTEAYANAKIRTPDVVEILDGKILATRSHFALGVTARENYDSILSKISLQVLTPAQKEAFDNTLTAPSASNPVVLKEDLQSYVPQADLGEIKDSVQTFAMLPLSGNSLGDLRSVIADNIIYRWNGTVWTEFIHTGTMDHTELSNQNGDVNFQHLGIINLNFNPGNVNAVTDVITITSHQLSNGVPVTFDSTTALPGSMLPAPQVYYIINATANTFQISLIDGGSALDLLDQGTGIHTLHVSQKDLLLTGSHTHSNLAVLENIIAANSGNIITAAERARIPSTTEKQALLGTSGVPSNTNRYVTNQDPRLNTTRNPYVTVGPPGSLGTFSGVDAVPFENALVAIDVGSATAVKAVEVLPGFFSLGGAILTWDTSNSALLIEAFTPGTVVLSFQTFQAGIQALGPGTGQITVRGFIFELNNLNTSGIRSQRENTIIEDCIFRPGPTISTGQVGITLEGANSVVRRCSFLNQLTKGVEIKAANCRVEECAFNLADPKNSGVHVMTGGNNSIIDHNTFLSGKIRVDSGVQFSQISSNYWNQNSTARNANAISVANPAVVSFISSFPYVNGDRISFTTTGALPTGLVVGKVYYVRNTGVGVFNVSETPSGSLIQTTVAGSGVHTVISMDFVLDSGYSTRFLNNQPEEFNQPYVGRIKTVGPTNSYADYRGDTDAVFLTALADVNTTEIEVLPGVYNFSTTVTVPQSCKIRGTTQGDATTSIIAASGVSAFELSTFSVLENLQIEGSNASLVISNSVLDFKIENCTFNLTAENNSNQYCLNLNIPTDCVVRHNTFLGMRGVSVLSSYRSKYINNKFQNTLDNLDFLGNIDHVKDNYFLTTVAPDIAGTDLIVEGNHFLGNLPSKLGTTGSVWQSNYPAPQANNTEGVDTIEVSLDGYLEPFSGNVVRSEIASAGALAFDQITTSSAITLPIKLPARLDTSAGFTVDLSWSSTLTVGDVVWEVTPVFRNEVTGVLGTSSSQQQTSTRTGLSATEEDSASFVFTTLAYGGSSNPTHVSIMVSRLGGHPADTLTDGAYLLDVKVTLPRD